MLQGLKSKNSSCKLLLGMKDLHLYIKDWPAFLNAEPNVSSFFKVMVICVVHSTPAVMGSHSSAKIEKKGYFIHRSFL